MARRTICSTTGTGGDAVTRRALTLAVVVLLLAGGPVLAAEAHQRAAPRPITVERPPEPAVPGVTDFMDRMTSIGNLDLTHTPPEGELLPQVPVDPDTLVVLYQSTNAVEQVTDAIAAYGPELFEVQKVGYSWWGEEIRAIHVRVPKEPEPEPARPDDAERPTLLVECNMHGREWLAMESCTRFLELLFTAYYYYPVQTLQFMRHVNLYVLPVTNPDGRNVDDLWFLDGTSTLWSSPIDFLSTAYWHGSGGLWGWRPSFQLVDCAAGPFHGFNFGIDLARNFSTGWTAASSNCMSQAYRGEYPFQAPEAAALRRFVNNRTVSMSLHVHSFAARFEIPNQNKPQAVAMRDAFIDRWNLALGALPDYEVVALKSTAPVGGGVGQFSGWLRGSSDSGQLDEGTHRAVNVFYLELPPVCEEYEPTSCPDPYYGSVYDVWADDESNAFHPTGPAIIEDVVPAFVNALAFFVKQAQYPWCAIDPDLTPGSCSDIGLTGSKIAADTHEIGVLDWVDTGTEVVETASQGSYGAVYRIQNFDTSATAIANVQVEIASKLFTSSSYVVDQATIKNHVLAPGGSDVGEVADSLFAYTAGRDYRVKIKITSTSPADLEPANNEHVFKFRVQDAGDHLQTPVSPPLAARAGPATP